MSYFIGTIILNIMTKLNRKSIKAEVTKEVAKQYHKRYDDIIKSLQERLNQATKTNKQLTDNLYCLKDENQQLRERLELFKDWNNRLQEWCCLPDDERTKAIAEYNKKFDEFKFTKEADGYLSKMFKPYFDALKS